MPGTRTLVGIDGIKTIYNDTLNSPGDVWLLRSVHDDTTLGVQFFDRYRQERARKGIRTHALTPQSSEVTRNQPSDTECLVDRTVLPAKSYNAPVEVDVYGDKVAFIAFGETQMATIINSPAIAEAMRQVFSLIHRNSS